MSKYLFLFESLKFSDFIDIAIVAGIVYLLYSQVAKTAALPVLQGFLIIIFITFLSGIFNLRTANYLLESVVSLMLLSVVILFPSEIRKALYRISGMAAFQTALGLENTNINILLKTIAHFKREKIGALFVICRKDSLRNIIETGIELNAEIQERLLQAVFQKESPLHDGAVVILRNKIVAASCIIPSLSSNVGRERKLGTRHRSALSLSEQSDALILVVSEENGGVSVAYAGDLKYSIGKERLKKLLQKYL